MGQLTEQIRAELTAAMKARDAGRLSTLRMLQSSFKYQQIEVGHELSDEEAMTVIRKAVKQRLDSIEQYTKGNRPELAAKEQSEMELLKTWLPADLTDDEIEAGIRAIVASTGATAKQDISKEMNDASAKYQGRVNGRQLQELVPKLLP